MMVNRLYDLFCDDVEFSFFFPVFLSLLGYTVGVGSKNSNHSDSKNQLTCLCSWFHSFLNADCTF